MAFHPSYRPTVGDWRRRVRERAAPLVASWRDAMEAAEDELRAEGNRFAPIREVEARARAILEDRAIAAQERGAEGGR